MDPDLYSEEDELCAELEDSLEDLEDGLDVLMILEKAYQKTLQSHVCRPEEASSSGSGSGAGRRGGEDGGEGRIGDGGNEA